jgi:hypothetical protein
MTPFAASAHRHIVETCTSYLAGPLITPRLQKSTACNEIDMIYFSHSFFKSVIMQKFCVQKLFVLEFYILAFQWWYCSM